MYCVKQKIVRTCTPSTHIHAYPAELSLSRNASKHYCLRFRVVETAFICLYSDCELELTFLNNSQAINCLMPESVHKQLTRHQYYITSGLILVILTQY